VTKAKSPSQGYPTSEDYFTRYTGLKPQKPDGASRGDLGSSDIVGFFQTGAINPPWRP